ncbi:MAG: aminopeptidase P family protein [Planctomycetota bacterium]|nr:aminopeptidase P family protein [Planctomycetota bacterium]
MQTPSNGSSAPAPDAIAAALRARRERIRSSWDGAGLGDALVLVAAGVAIPVEGTDAVYGFRAHDDHTYLSGSRRAAGVVVLDPTESDPWTLYVFEADATERVWHGDSDALEDVAAETALDQVRPLGALEEALSRHAGRPAALLGNHDLLMSPAAYELHPGVLEALDLDPDLSDALEACVHEARRTKDAVELDWMRGAAAATVAGHEAGMRAARAGLSEVALQIEIETAFLRAGAEARAYPSIVAGGPNAAVLHATPGARRLADDDLVLVDAGAELGGYDCDITRTWPVAGRFAGEQAALYDAVLAVQKRAIAGARAGVEYKDLHLEACRGIAEGLIELGVLRGDVDGLVERDAHALFFPHGIGHLIGLATHDVAGYLAGREPSDRPGLKYLRTDLPLQPGYVVTIEPGIYFIDALVNDPIQRETYADCVDFARAEALLPLGGVRIEDDVHVTDGEPEVLTGALAKERVDVEALCAG